MQMIPNDESRNEISSRYYFESLNWLVYAKLPPGWFQATGKGWLGYVQNEYQEDVQPYESGIDDALLQWLARVVLPRVLRFPPT